MWQRPMNSWQGKHDKGYHPGISGKHLNTLAYFEYVVFTEVSRGASRILFFFLNILHNNFSNWHVWAPGMSKIGFLDPKFY